jgi:multidrug efflux system membrane fusion protein
MTIRNGRYRSQVLLGLLLATPTLAGCGGNGTQANGTKGTAEPVAVRAAAVRDTTIARPIVAAGTVGPKDEIALSFKAGGVIARIEVDAGDLVRAGQSLAVLDLQEIDAALAKTRSGAQKAERDLARARRLYADSVVTLAQLQDAETAAELARADVQATAFNRRYASIVAPSSGTILRRSAEPGETVSPGTAVLVLGSRARGNVVEVGLADRDVVSVREGDPATARFDALPGETFEGRVTQIAAAADPGTGTYAVEVTLEHADSLASDLVGQLEIRPARGAPATLVPIEALLEADGAEATVYALSADGVRAERRRVTISFIEGDHVAVAGGLEGAAAVVTDGGAYLDDGTAVRVTP